MRLGFTFMQLSAWPDSDANRDTVREVNGCRGNLDVDHEEKLFDFSEPVDYRPQEEMPVLPAFTRDNKGLLPGYQTLAPLVPGHLRNIEDRRLPEPPTGPLLSDSWRQQCVRNS
ncbi:MAG: hypothetical protein OXP68_02945 [Anaerolineaceae bacterium]|nr:hypothetical protein [Anaerolineaceae bacterium]MDE0328033.1 hypothetical protein [Anaerolineaceae bacterium]